MKKIIAILLAIISLLTAFPIPSSAASSSRLSDELEDYLPLATYAAPLSGKSTICTYTSSSLKRKSGYCFKTFTTEIVIVDITNNGKAVKVRFPTVNSRGKTKVITKWCATDDILGLSDVSISSFVANQKETTYRMSSATKTKEYGSIAKKDSCITIGTKTVDGDTYAPTIYPISKTKVHGKNVRYKLALREDIPAREKEITEMLIAMMNGESHDGDYEVGTRYRGPYYTEQCKGFAKSVFKELFSYNIGSTLNEYKIDYSSRKTVYVGSVTNQSEDDLCELFKKGRPGDFVQMKRSHGGPHSAILVSVSSKGVVLLEANLDRKNTIVKKEYTWDDLSKNAAMSLYTAKAY